MAYNTEHRPMSSRTDLPIIYRLAAIGGLLIPAKLNYGHFIGDLTRSARVTAAEIGCFFPVLRPIFNNI